MQTLFRFGLFLLSMTGYIWYLVQRFHIRLEYAPALFCAWTSNALFAAGLLNVLPHAAGLLFAGGFICLLLMTQRNVPSLKDYILQNKHCLLRYAVFLCGMIYFFQLLDGAHFTSYDNFSHWATVVKDLLLQERMPNFEDAVIRFQSYPLGSSLFLFYVCRIVGVSDGCMLWAQLLMICSFLFVLALWIRRKDWLQAVFVLLCSIWMLSANNSIYELRVDTLLPAAGIAAFSILYREKEQPGKALYLSMGILMLLVNIKNSGIFFYLVCLLFFALYHRKRFWQYKNPFFAAGLLAPLAVIYLWKRHVAFAFSDGMSSKHSMNIAHFGEMAAKKTKDDILQIGLDIGRRFVHIENVEVQLMLSATIFLLLLMLPAFTLSKAGSPWKKLCRLLAAVWGCFLLYTVSLYAMYVFSMPMAESARLASYDRYILSVLIFLYGIIAAVVLDIWGIWSGSGRRIIFTAALLFAFLLVWQVRNRLELFIKTPDFARTKRSQLQELLQRDGIHEGDSVCLYVKGGDDNARYFFYLTRYELWTDQVLVIHEENFTENWQKIKDYHRLIIWEADENTDWYLKTHGYAQYTGIDQIGIAK